jgi:ankyrin repeat protein
VKFLLDVDPDLTHVQAADGATALPDLVHFRGHDGKTALHTAALMGEGGVVKFLLDRVPGIESVRDDDGKTAREVASAQGHIEVVAEFDRPQ